MAPTKQGARKSTGGQAPRIQLETKAARRSRLTAVSDERPQKRPRRQRTQTIAMTTICDNWDESDEGNEGDKGNEGDEGDEDMETTSGDETNHESKTEDMTTGSKNWSSERSLPCFFLT